MRSRLLLILLVAFSGLGADCDDGGHNGSASTSSSSFSSVAFGDSEGDNGFVAPMPEPSAMLVFSVGLLIAGAASRRNR